MGIHRPDGVATGFRRISNETKDTGNLTEKEIKTRPSRRVIGLLASKSRNPCFIDTTTQLGTLIFEFLDLLMVLIPGHIVPDSDT